MNCSVLYCTVLHCIVLYCIVLYCTVLYCIVLYCTELYCNAPLCSLNGLKYHKQKTKCPDTPMDSGPSSPPTPGQPQQHHSLPLTLPYSPAGESGGGADTCQWFNLCGKSCWNDSTCVHVWVCIHKHNMHSLTHARMQKMPHTKTRKFKPQPRLKLHSSIGGRLGKQTC